MTDRAVGMAASEEEEHPAYAPEQA